MSQEFRDFLIPNLGMQQYKHILNKKKILEMGLFVIKVCWI